MQEKERSGKPQHGFGCKVLLLLIVGCFVFAGIIFFVGRSIDGDRGSYYLFYTILILAIIAAAIYQYLATRNRKRRP